MSSVTTGKIQMGFARTVTGRNKANIMERQWKNWLDLSPKGLRVC